ncbi:MAG: hypothetical protein AUK54_05375 [Helicobacteraceae bacterium CG2_30_36_10]|nr:MAG: hypothetical protein AUK54_05375 [Helicobacteraceae bacterium CG2_30_36_10]
MVAKAIVTDTYLDPIEIAKHLKNVEYILMATPAPSHFAKTPIQFTIFLNTDEKFSQDIKDAILDKFLQENSIVNPTEVMSQTMPVGFGKSQQETPMPILLVKPQDQRSIPSALMHVIDFLGDSDKFYEAKTEKLTGWSYSYN